MHAQGIGTDILQGAGGLLVEELEGLGQAHLGIGAQGGAEGAEGAIMLGDEDLLGFEFEFGGEILADGPGFGRRRR